MAKQSAKTVDISKQFRRVFHSKGKLRSGLSRARANVSAFHFGEIVNELVKTPLYKSTIVPNIFPKDLRDIRFPAKIAALDRVREFLWCAAILKNFSQQISVFVSLRDDFDINLINGRYGRCNEILDELFESFGYSVWFLKNKLTLLQVSEGLVAQKEYVEAIMQSDIAHPMFYLVPYYVSNRLEDNVTKASFDFQTRDFDKVGLASAAFLFHFRPYDITWIEDSSTTIAMDEALPIIDRFESFVAMCELEISRAGVQASSFLRLPLLELRQTADQRINRLLFLLCPEEEPSNSAPALSAYDVYTKGNYEDALTHDRASLELKARAALHLDVNVSGDAADSQAIRGIIELLTYGNDYVGAEERLSKLALVYAGKPIALEIAQFLDSDDAILEESESNTVRYLAVSTDWNPHRLRIYESIMQRSDVAALFALEGESPSMILREALNGKWASRQLNWEAIPDCRANKYRGHLHFLNGEFEDAINHYRRAIEQHPIDLRTTIRAYLVAALIQTGEISECAYIISEELLRRENSFHAFPIQDLIDRSDIYEESNLDLAIVCYIAAKNYNAKYYSYLSDVFENFLDSLGVSKPSEVRNVDLELSPQFIFFLRNICVSRVLDETTLFSSVAEIEEERIKICQWLTELDPKNIEEYAAEIRDITRAARVASLVDKIDAGKIFVDEQGVQDLLDSSMRASFTRFKNTPDIPDLGVHASRISRHLGDLLGEKGKQEVQGLQLPASEADAILTEMLQEYVQQFATNPAFGLDTHLSTGIRHGAFVGHLRRPLSLQNLLSEYNEADGNYHMEASWHEKLSIATESELAVAQSSLARFTKGVNDLLIDFKQEKLRIRGEDQNKDGLFDFKLLKADRATFLSEAKKADSYDNLVPLLSNYCWQETSRSLDVVQIELKDTVEHNINRLLNQLQGQIEAKIRSQVASPLLDCIALARTELQSTFEAVSGWFRRPTELDREPFDFELAVEVAVKQIENCYVKQPVKPTINIEINSKFAGAHFDSLVEVLFLLLQNVVRHSGLTGTISDVSVGLKGTNQGFSIVVENGLSTDVDRDERELALSRAVQRYEHDSAMRMARQDIGSGLSKLWRILQFGLHRQHSLHMELSTNNRVVTSVTFDREGMIL